MGAFLSVGFFCVGCREKSHTAPGQGAATAPPSVAQTPENTSQERGENNAGSVESDAAPPAPAQGDGSTAQAAPAAPSSNGRPDKKAWNVLLITIDTLRADHLHCYGYFRETSPILDALAKESLVFTNCQTPAAQTLPSHASLFTGLYPYEHGLLSNAESVRDEITGERTRVMGLYEPSPKLVTFAQILAKNGYHTAGFVSAEPVKAASGINRGFQHWHEPPAEEDKSNADYTNRYVFDWLKARPWRAEGGDKPFFAWVHYFDVHAPFKPPSPYRDMFQSDEALDDYLKKRAFSAEATKLIRPEDHQKLKDSKEAVNLYDGEVRYTDAQIGELFDRLHEAGLWEKTIIVVTSDHGEGLGQHGTWGHGDVWLEHLDIPLIIRIPGGEPKRIETPMTNLDTLPTLYGLADLPGEEDFTRQSTGKNVLSPDYQPVPRIGYKPPSNLADMSSITDGVWRYMETTAERGNGLYRIDEDPFELNNLIEKFPEKAGELKGQLERLLKAQHERGKAIGAGKLKPLTEQATKNLGELGYVESDEDEGARPRRRPENAVNPASSEEPGEPAAENSNDQKKADEKPKGRNKRPDGTNGPD